MRDALGSFEGKAKAGWDGRQPRIGDGGAGQAAEGIVHFDGVELGCVILKELFRRNGFRVKVGFPTGIGPAGAADVDRAGQ